jgi:cytochrome P450
VERSPRLDVDFTDPAMVQDPYSVYEEIRAEGPVVWTNPGHGWMVVGHAACSEVLGDPRGTHFGVVGARRPEVTFWFDAPNMIIADGAEHRRLRQGVSKYFNPTTIKRTWEPRVREVVEQQLAPIVGRGGELDLFGDFTKIPVVIVAELLGVPEERHDDFRRWSIDIITNLQFGHEGDEHRRIMQRAIDECNAYLDEEIERHRRDQPDDLLTVMVNMPDWSEAEIRSSSLNLLVAGYDTTAKLMGECLVALEQHPDQRALLVEQPDLVPNAVEEVLRWHGAAQSVIREVVQDTTLAGTELAAGDMLYVMLAAANRDPERWEDPARFDVRRPFRAHLGLPHLGFGGGPHICIGAPLARLEVQVALETLLRLAPEYTLRDIDYGEAYFARGPEHGFIDVPVREVA